MDLLLDAAYWIVSRGLAAFAIMLVVVTMVAFGHATHRDLRDRRARRR